MKAKKVYDLVKDNEINPKNIIDIRDAYELKAGKVNKSTNINMNKLLSRPENYLNKDDTYYIICQSGGRSFSTWLNLKLKGYKVKNISGGYNAWKTIDSESKKKEI